MSLDRSEETRSITHNKDEQQSPHLKPTVSDTKMGPTLWKVLVTALKKLEEPSFQRFIEKLSVWDIREEFRNIPKDELIGKDPEHVAGLINDYYNYSYGAEVTLAVLEEIGEKKVREELQHDLRTVDTSGHGLGTAMYTDKVNFIADHRADLIIRITHLYPVLCGLQDEEILTEEQYKEVMKPITSQEKMEKLCDIIRRWEDTDKYTAYTVLRKYNEEIIRDLEKKEKMRRYANFQHFREKVNFIDDQMRLRYQSGLIRRIKNVDPVLCDLRDQKLLTQGQYKHIMKYKLTWKKMRELYDIRHWKKTEKYTMYTVLLKYNEEIIKDMEMKARKERTWQYDHSQHVRDHFLDRHRSHLIYNIKEVNLVLDDLRSHNLLAEEDYKGLRVMTTPKEKMSRLYDIFWHQSDTVKDQFYISLWRYNYTVIHNLEISENFLKSSTHKTPEVSTAQDHFIDRHREELIDRIKIVDPVIDDLYRKNLLTIEEYYHIIKAEDRMRRLYDVIRHWDVKNKEKAYRILYEYNPGDISSLNAQEESPKKEKKRSGHEPEKPLMSDREMKDDAEDDGHSHKLSDKDSVEVVIPTITGSTYCLSMDSPGLFRCSESGIQFRVTRPVTIEYEVDSWSNYDDVLQNLRGGYEVIGPLFNIKSSAEPNVVAAVYLPHCLYLEGFKGDKSLIKCFHYKDDNLVLEAPSRLDPMYVVLENPTFSPFGVILYPLNLLKEQVFKLIAYQGMALLFYKTITRDNVKYKYKLHLYLQPRIRTVEKDVVSYETSHSFQRIHKPSLAESVYHKKKYRIKVPLAARVFPKTLLFENHCSSEIPPFTEISIEGETDTEVNVSLHPEDDDITVWETVVYAEEMLDLPFAISRLKFQPGGSIEHFVDKHRKNLIDSITSVAPVLDYLKQLRLLSNEEYETVRSKDISQDQMRELYRYINSWDERDKNHVWTALETHNPSTIRKLERM